MVSMTKSWRPPLRNTPGACEPRIPSGLTAGPSIHFVVYSLPQRSDLLVRRSVIVDDLPSLFEPAEDESVKPAGFLAVGHRQFPSPAHDRRVRSQLLNVEIGEGQFAHLPAFGLIGFAITV